MSSIHEQFVAEARELVHQATDDLLAIEREGAVAERIDRVFRAFHTLKGSAGLVELPAMTVSLHAAEDLMAAIRGGRLQVNAKVVDDALACLDQVSHWVTAFDAHGALSPAAGDDARMMADRLRIHLSRQADGTAQGSAAGGLPDWVSRLLSRDRDRIFQQVGGVAADLVAVSYEPHGGCFYDGDDPLQLMRQVPGLLALEIELRGDPRPLAEFDPFDCRIRLHAVAQADRDALAAIFRLVPDQVRILQVPGQAVLAIAAALPAASDDGSALIRAVINEQRDVIRLGAHGEDFAGRVGAAARVTANALRHAGNGELAGRIARAGAVAIATREAAPLVAVLGEALDVLTPAQPGAASGSAAFVGPMSTGTTEEAEGASGRSLRIDEARIDALVDLAGELIVLKNSFAHLAKRIETELGSQDLSRAVKREQLVIERLSADMHNAVLQLRMVPVAQVLRAFPRLVRDLAQRLHKNVNLVTSGETTESDKAVVDRLFEPLVHLLRNALDHGIELPAERRAAGKPEAATLTIATSRLGDRLVLEVADDGRGIDPDMIRRKVRERGLLHDDALAGLGDDQVLELIFSAGLSTAAEISDISGRGVGMDVVRTTIDQIGGRVGLTSRVGVGTNVRLDVPVNIATSRIMVVESGGQVFGIPMDAVSQTVRLTADRISRVKNNEGFILRDRVVPICSLAELMNLPDARVSQSDGRLVMVIEIGAKIAAVEIDAIRDRLDVVLKPMQGLLANALGYAGTTLLGDGSVLLVLDVKELVP